MTNTNQIAIEAEVADTPNLLSQGLMWREKLGQNNGMLFKFPSLIEASFWGKNTYIPLDIAFIDAKNKIVDIGEIAPLSTRMVRSKMPCVMAIEVNNGFFKTNNITVGDTISIETKDSKCHVRFSKCG